MNSLKKPLSLFISLLILLSLSISIISQDASAAESKIGNTNYSQLVQIEDFESVEDPQGNIGRHAYLNLTGTDQFNNMTLGSGFTSGTSGELGYCAYMNDENSSHDGWFYLDLNTGPYQGQWNDSYHPYLQSSVKRIVYDLKISISGDTGYDAPELQVKHYTYRNETDDYTYYNIFDLKDLEQDKFQRMIFSAPLANVDTYVVSIQGDTGPEAAWEGNISVVIDNIKVEYRTSKVVPFLYNQFTGLGLQRELLQLQFKNSQGRWESMGYDPHVFTIFGENVTIRALDYWNQEIFRNTITALKSEIDLRIPVPLIKVEIKHQEDWGKPKIRINSMTSDMAKYISSYEFKIIGGRTYDFIWSDFGRFLNGSSEISFGYGKISPNGTVTTPDRRLSDIQGGNTLLDLDMHVDPDYYRGQPPLDWSDWSKFGTNIIATIGYNLLGLDYRDWRVYKDPIWPDWIYAVSQTKEGRAVAFLIALFSLSFAVWRYYIYKENKRRIDDVERREGIQ